MLKRPPLWGKAVWIEVGHVAGVAVGIVRQVVHSRSMLSYRVAMALSRRGDARVRDSALFRRRYRQPFQVVPFSKRITRT
jgi:hypothetical protein